MSTSILVSKGLAVGLMTTDKKSQAVMSVRIHLSEVNKHLRPILLYNLTKVMQVVKQ